MGEFLFGWPDGISARTDERRSRAAELPHRDAELFWALSAMLSLMPGPGKCITPFGRISSISSLRWKGAARPCFVQSGAKPICGTFRCVAQSDAIFS
jgi:hypothetical protein